MRNKLFFIAGALIINQSLSICQTTDTLSLDDCVQLGLRNNKKLHTAQLRVEQAQAKQDEVFAALLPALRGAAGYTRLSDVPAFAITIPSYPRPVSMTVSEPVLNNYQARLSLQQPLYTGNRLTGNLALQRQNRRAAQQDLRAERNELAFSVKSAYWNLYQAHEFRDVVDDNIRQVQAHLSDVTNLANQGMATGNDRLKVQLQLSNARLMQIDAANLVRVAEIQLNNLTGRPLEARIALASTIDTLGPDSGPLETSLHKAGEQRPELISLQSRVDGGRAGVSMARAGWYPQVYGTAGYTYARPNARIFPARDRFDATWDVGVALSLDLWNWRSIHFQVKQAKAQLSQAEDALSLLRDAVSVEVNILHLDLRKCREKIAVSRDGVGQAAENHRTTRERFRNGAATNTDLLDAENLLLQARLNLTRALVEHQIARARMEKAVGE